MISASLDGRGLEDRLRLFGSGLGLIFHELLRDVGERMAAEVAPPRKTGRLAGTVRFLPSRKDRDPSALTTRKTLSRRNIRYANPVEHGSTVTSRGRETKGEYVNKRGTKVVFDKTNRLFFKMDGQWVTVEKTKPRAAQPFMKPVFDRYFGGDGSLGYRELANALRERMAREVL